MTLTRQGAGLNVTVAENQLKISNRGPSTQLLNVESSHVPIILMGEPLIMRATDAPELTSTRAMRGEPVATRQNVYLIVTSLFPIIPE